MDARHRDKVAFIRVCSGRFEKGMKVRVARTGAPSSFPPLPHHVVGWCGDSCPGNAFQLLVRVPYNKYVFNNFTSIIISLKGLNKASQFLRLHFRTFWPGRRHA